MARRARAAGLLAAACLVTLLALPHPAAASNPFSSNVVALTPKNWKELEKSPHAWFVNICRAG